MSTDNLNQGAQPERGSIADAFRLNQHPEGERTTSGMNVHSPVTVLTKQVDSKNIAGSFAGTDTRVSGDTAKPSLDAIASADPIANRFKAEPAADDKTNIGG